MARFKYPNMVLLLVVLLALPGIAPRTVQGQEVTRAYDAQEFPVCLAPYSQLAPDTDGQVIVWEDGRASTGPWHSDKNDIYGYDLRTGQEFPICTAPGRQGNPAVHSPWVVWEDYRQGFPHGAIFTYNLDTGEELQVTTPEAAASNPAIHGSIIVWQDYRHGNADIYGYNLATGKEFPICTAPGFQGNPAIWGQVVVWQDNRRGNYDIYGYNLGTGEEFVVAAEEAIEASPAISGEVVVWADYRHDQPDIYARNLRTGETFPIATEVAGESTPAIAGSLVVWQVVKEALRSDLDGYDLETGQRFPVSRAIGGQIAPAIGGDVVVWVDYRRSCGGKYNSASDLFAARLIPGPVSGPLPVAGAPSATDAKIEILWPHDGKPGTTAERANISFYLLQPGTLNAAPVQWAPVVWLWEARDNRPARPIATAWQFPSYPRSFNNVDVSYAQNPRHRLYYFLEVEGVSYRTNVWTHAADARTYFPEQDVPTDVLDSPPSEVDAVIEIVWPHGGKPVSEAELVNVTALLFAPGTRHSVPPDWSPVVRLYRALNNGYLEPVAVGVKRLVTRGNLTYPAWDFNNVNVSAARDPLNKYYFLVRVDGIRTYPNVWVHGADARTYFPQQDLLTSPGCTYP